MRRFLQYGLIYVGLVVLVGCGGNGGNPMSTQNTDQDTDQPARQPARHTVDLAGLPGITIPANTVINAGESMNFGTGQNEVTISCPSGGTNCALMQADGGVTSTGGQATAMLSGAAVNARRQAGEARERMITGLTMAIAGEDGTGGLNKAQRPGGADLTLGLTFDGDITYTATSASPSDRLGEVDETVANEFDKSNEARATIEGWKTLVYDRTLFGRGIKDVLAVYTDRDEPQHRAYMSFFANSNMPSDGEAESLAINRRPGIISGITDYGEAGNTNNTDPTLNNNAEAGVFDENRTGEGTLFFTPVTTPEADHNEDLKLFGGELATFRTNSEGAVIDEKEYENEKEVPGTFHGIRGNYVCMDSAGCNVTSDDDGNLATLSAGWRFVPDEARAKGNVQNVLIDVDHLVFGYWLQTTTDADGSITYGVNTFANGSLPFDDDPASDNNAAILGLEGSAKYNGKATGMYALKSFESGAGVPTASGQFTADASLTANFGGHAVAVSNQFSISGNVMNFRDSAGEPISNGGWTVELKRADFVSTAADNSTRPTVPDATHFYSNSFSGTTTGGGSWDGAMYGSGADMDAVTSGIQAEHPTGVTGEFNAHLGNGHVIGAFGATRK